MKKIDDLNVKIFSDGADKNEMLDMNKKNLIKGFTTNPSLMKKAGIKDYKLFAKEILNNNKIIIFLTISNHNTSMLTAQYLNSGIFPIGSKAGFVRRLAAASL